MVWPKAIVNLVQVRSGTILVGVLLQYYWVEKCLAPMFLFMFGGVTGYGTAFHLPYEVSLLLGNMYYEYS